MDDLISRQAVLKQLADRIEATKKWHEDCVAFENETGEQASYRALMDFNEVRLMVENLPSAQPDVPDTDVGDTISRQAAIDALKDASTIEMKRRIENIPPEPRWFTKGEIEAINAQPEPRWIPVEDKDRLPRDGQRVLVTDEDGEIDIAYFIDFTNIDESVEWWAHDYQCHPIAWSETPKPYERSEE